MQLDRRTFCSTWSSILQFGSFSDSTAHDLLLHVDMEKSRNHRLWVDAGFSRKQEHQQKQNWDRRELI